MPFKSYAQSKLATAMFSAELDHRAAMHEQMCPSGGAPTVSAVSVHPGIVNTALARRYFEDDWIAPALRPLLKPVLRALFPACCC